jgi:hypothetical protein
MKRSIVIVASVLGLVLLLAGGAFVAGRLLSAGPETGDGDGPTIKIGTGKGPLVEAQWVPAEECPAADPDVAGVYAQRQDNSIFIDETQDGFRLAQDETGSVSVINATGQIHEVVVTGETNVYVDTTNENIEEALSDGKLYQKISAGSIEEIADLSYVRAWGERRGDRLIASVLIYMRPPVINR